ncbi:MAG: response regulator [Bryobacterales bacterium]|nr:response regulator [Bryobacterales bacterium]
MANQILIVEDSGPETRLMSVMFEEVDPFCSLSMVSSDESALRLLETGVIPDLTLVDLNIPTGGAPQFIERLRQLPGMKNQPVVVLSNVAAPEQIRACYDRGADAYVQKPSTLEDLELLVRRMCSFWLRAKTRTVSGRQ